MGGQGHPCVNNMKKVFCILLAIAMALCGIGCGEKEPVEEIVPAEEAIADVKEEEIILGEPMADGLVPNGLIAIYLDGDNAYDRLAQFSVDLGDMYWDVMYELEEPIVYDYLGIGNTETGAVLNCQLKKPEDSADVTVSMSAEMKRIECLISDVGFNKGECHIEYDLAKPPFLYSEGVMENMFLNSKGGDVACVHAHFTCDNYLIYEKTGAKIVQRMAKLYGYPVSESTLAAEDYRMCSNSQSVDFSAGYDINYACTSLKNCVPTFLRYLQENTCCEGVADAKEGMNAWKDDMEFYSRTGRTLAGIFGEEVLTKICRVGAEEALRVLDLGTDYILQSNWGLVYTDVQGNFRVRLSLMVKDPAGKTGWYVTAYEVLVNPVEGDMFTCADYAATGEIIQILPLITFEKSVESGTARAVNDKALQTVKDGEYGLTPNDICHAFYCADKLEEIEELYPEWLAIHRDTCRNMYCIRFF